MADYLVIERFDTYTGVGDISAEEIMEIAPLAYKYEKRKNTIQKG